MEYQNIIIFVLIFIVLMTVFYLIISNFGITNTNYSANNKTDINYLENKIWILDNELRNMKNNITNNLIKKSNDSVKEIIIETDNSGIIMSENKQDLILASETTNTDTNTNTNTLPNSNQIENIVNKGPPIIYDPIANYDIAKLTDPLVDPRGRTSADQIPTPQVAAQFNFPTQGVLDRYHRVGLLIAIDNHAKTDSEFNWKGFRKTKKNKKRQNYSELNNIKTYKGVDIRENFYSDNLTDSTDSMDSDDSMDSTKFDYIENFSSNKERKIVNIYNNNSNLNDNNILELIGKKITDNWYKYFTSITMGNKIIKVVIRNKNRRELYSGDIVFIHEIGKSFKVKIDPMDMIDYNPYMF